MTEHVTAKSGVAIRLTPERWMHITEEHSELAGMRLEVLATISAPLRILAGFQEELLALSEIESGKYLVVVYRELAGEEDGFVITAFMTRRLTSLNRRKQVWPT
jgi:hypothetical protein